MFEKLEERMGRKWVRRIKIIVLTAGVYTALLGPLAGSSDEEREVGCPDASKMPYVGKNYQESMKNGEFTPKYKGEKNDEPI